jgi:hypothetical protein
MSDYWILDGDDVRRAGLMEWAAYFEKADRHIGRDEIGLMKVSTVFLGLNHNYGDGPPLLFETMVFGGPIDEETERYSTKAEALAGHQKLVERCRHIHAAASFGQEDPPMPETDITDAAVEAACRAQWASERNGGSQHDAMRAALTAAAPLMAGWRDISSAPKNGTPFLMGGHKDGKPYILMEAYHLCPNTGFLTGCASALTMRRPPDGLLWLPLPTPTNTQGGAG